MHMLSNTLFKEFNKEYHIQSVSGTNFIPIILILRAKLKS